MKTNSKTLDIFNSVAVEKASSNTALELNLAEFPETEEIKWLPPSEIPGFFDPTAKFTLSQMEKIVKTLEYYERRSEVLWYSCEILRQKFELEEQQIKEKDSNKKAA